MIESGFRRDIVIDRYWDGTPARADEVVDISFQRTDDAFVIEVEAPFYDDPAPEAPPGRTDELWQHEVVEVFLVGEGDRYLEVELGPHGHFLVLLFEGERNLLDDNLVISYEASADEARWEGRAEIPLGLIPDGLCRFNAYAIHGPKPRHFLAHCAVPGEQPDFHQLAAFAEIEHK